MKTNKTSVKSHLDCSGQQLSRGGKIRFVVSLYILQTLRMSLFANCSISLHCSLASGVTCPPTWAQTYPISICIDLTGSRKINKRGTIWCRNSHLPLNQKTNCPNKGMNCMPSHCDRVKESFKLAIYKEDDTSVRAHLSTACNHETTRSDFQKISTFSSLFLSPAFFFYYYYFLYLPFLTSPPGSFKLHDYNLLMTRLDPNSAKNACSGGGVRGMLEFFQVFICQPLCTLHHKPKEVFLLKQ